MTRELPSGKIIVRLAPQQSRYDDSPRTGREYVFLFPRFELGKSGNAKFCRGIGYQRNGFFGLVT
jgi:hypothetical protein